MRFTALLLPIILGAATAGPCRPSSAESVSSAETTELISLTTTDVTATLPIEHSTTTDANTAVPTTEIGTVSTTTRIAESTTESAVAASSTTAASGQCVAPASLQCCQTIGTPTNSQVSLLLGLLGIVIRDTSTSIGLTCTSVPNPGACPAIPACCSDNSHGGLLSVGCARV
ncbi:hydrophobin [Fusarium sporotrichioides]|uniref:Hydrophobin n=1 Tax=Fusarium sporotrichioides TaxID=5514 RepID=A0A395SRH8_FUSSP|nr:hydrophobin [Fusarium sporotrichioides]